MECLMGISQYMQAEWIPVVVTNYGKASDQRISNVNNLSTQNITEISFTIKKLQVVIAFKGFI